MVKVVKYEVKVKVSGEKTSEEVRVFRKLRNAREYVAQVVKGLECGDYKVSGDEMVRECKGDNSTVEVRIVRHSLKKYEVSVKTPDGKEEKVVLPTFTEAMSFVSNKAKELGLDCKEPTLNNGVRTIECEKEGKKMTAEIKVQKGSLPKGKSGKEKQVQRAT